MIGEFEKFWRNSLIFVWTAFFVGCNTTKIDQMPSPLGKEILLPGKNGLVRFTLEVVDTPDARARGLMERRSLPENHGMLFVFERMGRHTFWMKNTPLFLDIIFFDETFRVVGIIENAEPFSLASLTIVSEAKYALEVVAGSVKKHGINLHSLARLSYMTKS